MTEDVGGVTSGLLLPSPAGTGPRGRHNEREDTMSGNLKAFLEAAMADPDLREKLAKMDAGEIVAAARERGFELTEADLAPPAGEVGDEELGNVAGGKDTSQECVSTCPLIGGAYGTDSDDGNTYYCFCIAYGQGGDGGITDTNCFCIFSGLGSDTNK